MEIIISLGLAARVLELRAGFRAAQVDPKQIRSRRARDKPSPLYAQQRRNFTDIGLVGSVYMTLVKHEPFPAYLEERRELGRIALAVRDAGAFVTGTLADVP